MSQEKYYEEFNGKTLTIINNGADRESWDLYEYKIYDGDYLLWSGYIHSSDARINDLSDADKKVIELNLLFKNVAKITNYGKQISLINSSSEDFIDWLIYNDSYSFRKKIHFEQIIVIDNMIEKKDYIDNAMYNATIIKKCPYGNVVEAKCKNTLELIKQSYLKKDIEILASYTDEDGQKLFKINIDYKGLISIPFNFIEETLLPGAIPEEAKIKINELKK